MSYEFSRFFLTFYTSDTSFGVCFPFLSYYFVTFRQSTALRRTIIFTCWPFRDTQHNELIFNPFIQGFIWNARKCHSLVTIYNIVLLRKCVIFFINNVTLLNALTLRDCTQTTSAICCNFHHDTKTKMSTLKYAWYVFDYLKM